LAVALTPVVIVGTGLDFDSALMESADASGNYITAQTASTQKTFLRVANGSGSPITVTIDSVVACDQGFDHDLAVAVPAGDEYTIGPIDRARYDDGSGYVQITYSGVTSLTVQAVFV